MSTTTTTRPGRANGRCPVKGCRTRASVVAEVTERRMVVGRDRFGNDRVERTRGTRVAAIDDDGRTGMVPVHEWADTCGPVCVEHHRRLRFVPVVGTVDDSVRCSATCTNAIGPSCDCACGGANHGAGHGS